METELLTTHFTHRYLKNPKLWRDTFNDVHLELDDGTSYVGIKTANPFPLSAPCTCIFFEDTDGNEIGLIDRLDDLDQTSQAVIREELALDHFITRITAISRVRSAHGMTTWELITNRGPRTVHVKERGDIRTLPGQRVILTDVHGMRYEVKDTGKLDDKSQALLESEM